MERQDFFSQICKRSPKELASFYLGRTEAAAFDNEDHYREFIELVAHELGAVERVAVVGTGNWKFSLNPKKNFKSFNERSDIDVAVVSAQRFYLTWEELRRVHRTTWALIDQNARERLRRNGENVYGGFVTPAWIPGARNTYRFKYEEILNRLSNRSPGRREVKMLFFKNDTEAVDYYRRGFEIAKRNVR